MTQCDYYRGCMGGVYASRKARRTPGATHRAGGGVHISSVWKTRRIFLLSLYRRMSSALAYIFARICPLPYSRRCSCPCLTTEFFKVERETATNGKEVVP